MHPHLLRQLRRLGIEDPSVPPTPEQWSALLTRVSRAYEDYDQDRYLFEQSLAVSSREMQDLLDRLQASSESRLASERNRLRSLISAMGAGLATLDLTGRVVALNPEGQRLLGWTEEELRGASFFEHVFPEGDPAERCQQFREAIAGTQVVRGVEARFRRRDGKLVPVTYSLDPLVEEGVTVGAAVVFLDITPLALAREALTSRDAILEAVSYAARRFLRERPWQRHAPELLARLGAASGVSRGYIFQCRPSPEGMVLDQRFEWTAPGVAGFGDRLNGFSLARGGFRRWERLLRNRRPVGGPVSQLPLAERAPLARLGIRSILAVPIFVGEEWWGVIGFDDRWREREWPSGVIDALTAAAGVIGAAIRADRDEAALREREHQYRTVVDSVREVVFQTDCAGRWTFLNPAWATLTGVPVAESVGVPACAFLHPDDAPAAVGLAQRVLAGELAECEFTARVRTASGAFRWVAVALRAIRDHAGVASGLAGSLYDLTERKAAEDALRRRNEVLAALHESALDLMNRRDLDDLLRTIIDRAGRACSTTDGFVHLVAPSGDHMTMRVGTGVFAPLQGRRIEPGEGVAGRVWQSGRPLAINDYEHWEGALHHSKRVERFDALVGIPLVSEGRVLGVLGLAQRPGKPGFSEDDVEILSLFAQLASIAIDNVRLYLQAQEEIEERKQAAEALRRSEERVRALLDAIPDLMLRINREGVFVDYKPGRAEAQAVPPQWVIGRRLWDTFPAERAARFFAAIRYVLVTGQPQQFEFSFQSGEKVFDREARFTRCGEDEVLVIVRDITERKRVERLKNEFVSMVSHELRTPLTSIRGALGLLAGGVAGSLPPSAAHLVEIAHKNSERLVRLINDILDIEKVEAGKVQFQRVTLDLQHLVDQAIEANEGYAQQFGVRLVVIPQLPGAIVQGDPDRLMQVLTNLIANAVKFSPRGEAVTIGLQRREGALRVSITDRGPGIPEDFRDRVFEKFAQADPSDSRPASGSGLGLAISKAIIDRLGGRIGFETGPGGTTFWFELAEASAEVLTQAEEAPADQPAVLVGESDPDTAMLLRFMLRAAGFRVDAAHSAAEARRLLASRDYAAMTLDLVLPDGDGVALIRELRAYPRTARLPIIAVSLTAERGADELNGDAVELVDWVGKPIDPGRLAAAVDLVASRVRPRPARILHVEDEPDIQAVVSAILGADVTLVAAASVEAARQLLVEHAFDLVILDLALPDGSGLTLLPLIARASSAPAVLLFTGRDLEPDTSRQIARALVRARTSNERLLATIRALVLRSTPVPRGVGERVSRQ
ncbi:MAG: hypothetical protein KatS3mg061_1991 [Dehalococcoidia bacterium]|nr:MAG: hypothetical protein KatS3mg061_1991 [Dehalococcoidia bacterium]